MAEQAREQKMWWVAQDGRVTEELGYRCTPTNPEYWWFPDLGSSLSERTLAATRNEAVNIARNWIAAYRVQLDKLERELGA